jgi:Polysulphide reductase, NrfD
MFAKKLMKWPVVRQMLAGGNGPGRDARGKLLGFPRRRKMSLSTLPSHGDDREGRLLEIRREAQQHGHIQPAGVHLEGAPFPSASSENGYYGMPLLQRPAWTWQVPLYFFVGGASGAAAVIGAMADWVGHDQEIARRARTIALCSSIASSGLLISGLGRPERFLYMLRVFKSQSPMSMGAWILAAFGSSSGLAILAPAIHKRLHWRTLGALGAVGKSVVSVVPTAVFQLHRGSVSCDCRSGLA